MTATRAQFFGAHRRSRSLRPSQNPEPTRRANRSRFRAGRRASHQTDNDGFLFPFTQRRPARSASARGSPRFVSPRSRPRFDRSSSRYVYARRTKRIQSRINRPTLSTPSKRLQTPRLTTHPVDSSQPSPSVRSSSIPSSPSPSPSSSFLPVPRRPVRSLATSFAPVAGSPLAASSSPNPSPGSHHPEREPRASLILIHHIARASIGFLRALLVTTQRSNTQSTHAMTHDDSR